MKNLKWLGGLAAMALLLSSPQAATRGAVAAMAQWGASVAPALFPFLALMPLLTCGDAIAAYEALLGRFTAAARDIAARAGMNRGQLQRLAVATAGFSPAFLVGGIGVGILNNPALGWKLLGAQLLTQMSLMLSLRRAWQGHTEPVAAVGFATVERPVRGAVLGILTICGYMTLFGALAGALGEWVGRGPADVLLCLMDVPSGALRVSRMALPDGIMLTLLAGMCGFGGLCVIAQSLGALRGSGVSAGEYIGIRAVAGLLCAGYMALLQGLPPIDHMRLIEPIRENPLAAGALIASVLAVPMLSRRLKSIS